MRPEERVKAVRLKPDEAVSATALGLARKGLVLFSCPGSRGLAVIPWNGSRGEEKCDLDLNYGRVNFWESMSLSVLKLQRNMHEGCLCEGVLP